ncbi:hypothetical protein J132_00047 [Termitomyces sp. J132]|nr:hypothetical protein J132_00047 [Termitomyces sp. J132]
MCLRTIELENGLPSNLITLALWLKNPDLRLPKQTVASLKISCNDPTTANDMIRGCIFIGGRQVSICKDVHEPICCSNCQKYGHY